METTYHKSVLLQESISGLNIKPKGTYIDVTFGGGGHSLEVLSKLDTNGRLFSFDQDADALANTLEDSRFELIPENYRYLKQHLKYRGILKVDGIIADFGVSSHQIDTPERGFSTRYEGKLDMRMNQQSSLDAKQIINTYSEEDLIFIFKTYGELRQARKLATTIVQTRDHSPITTTIELQKIIQECIPSHKQAKFSALIFQALRIAVNDEINAIKDFLIDSSYLLSEGGRLSVISYHSLEDRLVKRFMRNGLFEGEASKDLFGNTQVPFRPVGKLIIPDKNEIENNKRARSAKLRIAERTNVK